MWRKLSTKSSLTRSAASSVIKPKHEHVQSSFCILAALVAALVFVEVHKQLDPDERRQRRTSAASNFETSPSSMSLATRLRSATRSKYLAIGGLTK